MPLNLASPGIRVREVDLTVGRVDPTSDKFGGIVAPFAQGPVDLPVTVGSEKDLLDNFGKPYGNDKHYEHWMVASSYLAYGGQLRVVRSDDDNLYNAVSSGSSIKIKSLEHYEQLQYDENTITGRTVIAKNPGSWANGIRVGLIDAKADQILGINTSGSTQFVGVATASDGDIGITTTFITGITTLGISEGQIVKPISGIIESETTVSSIGIGTVFLNKATLNTVSLDNVELSFGSNQIISLSIAKPVIGMGITQSVSGRIDIGEGTTSSLDGYIKGIITEVDGDNYGVKVLSHVSAAGKETVKDYTPSGIYSFYTNQNVAIHTSGKETSYGSASVTSSSDWFDQQTIAISTSTVGGTTTTQTLKWNTIVDRPGTSQYAADRGSRFDEVHVVVIDGEGKITGNTGTILEKHLNLSKAKDAKFSVGTPSYWRSYLKANSQYIFGGSEPSSGVTTTGFTTSFNLQTDIGWDQDAEGVIFAASGKKDLVLKNGKNYDGTTDISATGALQADLNKLVSGYGIFENTENYSIDFLIMGSANYQKEIAQALANKLIAVADIRKDAIAFISPYRGAFITDTNAGSVTVNNDETITDNVISFYAPITSSSYAVFDSGYKYMFDRFSNNFRYIPLNGDMAGLCARNDIDNFPWFSPAGTTRGAILNAVKLAYNPSKIQRDRLYSNRINPVIFSPGSGIILFGDKTGLGKSSAFDRINVRRLFIYLENAISSAARDQLFEFNDEITRTNFVNVVEPFLRDVQAKRGIQDYVVICDETNNTAAVIDNNEFVADIFIKPQRSINFIGLTFVATRTGVSFEEVIGNV